MGPDRTDGTDGTDGTDRTDGVGAAHSHRSHTSYSSHKSHRSYSSHKSYWSYKSRWSHLACAAVALALLAACGRETPTTAPARPPVIIISIDTLRADHLPAYGYRAIQTPHLDAFRRDAILFENAYAQVPLTLPSHVSMLTGTLPPVNGVRNNIGFRFDAEKHETIPQYLKKHGYASGAAVSAYVLRGTTGLRTAFDDYDDAIVQKEGAAAGQLQRDGRESAAIAKRWIDARRGTPFFYMLHLFEPHTPYEPSYDGEIVKSDAIVGDFLDHLRRAGLYDDALIVVMSDHGEGLGEHGEEEHGIFLYREAIRVPLLVKLPKQQRANSSIARAVQLVDIFPTVAAVVAGESPRNIAGVSLLEEPKAERRAYAETIYPRIHLGWSELRSLADQRFHYIEAPSPELYDVAADPAERANVVKDQRRTYAAMRQELEAVPRGSMTAANIDPEEAKKLTALGYLGGGSSDATGPLPDPKERIGDLTALKEANRLAQRNELGGAIALLRRVTAQSPRFADAWTLLAQTLQRSGATGEAIEAYRRVLQVAPSLSAEVGLSLADLYLRQNRFEEAAAHAKLGEALNPGLVHLTLGRIALLRRDYGAALAESKAAAQHPAQRLAATILGAQVLAATSPQAHPQALATLEQVRREVAEKKLEPLPLLDFARGDLLARMNRPDEAEQAFLAEIRNFPHEREPYASLTILHAVRGDGARARATMQAMVQANPSSESYRYAADVFKELGASSLEREFRAKAR